MALALLLGVSALPAVAQVNPFGKAGGDLSAEDWVAINEARDGALADPAAVGASRAWTNPKSGNSGTIAITGVIQHETMECRAVEYVFHFKAQQRSATAQMKECKTADGSWKYLM